MKRIHFYNISSNVSFLGYLMPIFYINILFVMKRIYFYNISLVLNCQWNNLCNSSFWLKFVLGQIEFHGLQDFAFQFDCLRSGLFRYVLGGSKYHFLMANVLSKLFVQPVCFCSRVIPQYSLRQWYSFSILHVSLTLWYRLFHQHKGSRMCGENNGLCKVLYVQGQDIETVNLNLHSFGK